MLHFNRCFNRDCHYFSGDVEVLYLEDKAHIDSSRPLLVGVIIRSQDGKAAGATDPSDPSLYILPPVREYAWEHYMPVFIDADGVPYQKAELIVSTCNRA